MNDHPPTASPEVVRHDHGGWLSGPSITTEPVPAGDIQAGDRLLIDGTVAEVTDVRTGDFWLNTGRHAPSRAAGASFAR